MRKRQAEATDAELAVLKALWRMGGSTIRELTAVLYPGGGTAHYATVQKLLERLEGKRCVRRRPRGRANEFTATVERDDLIIHRLRETADKLCDGSLAPLLTQLVSASRLSDEDLAALRRLVESRETGTGKE